MRRLALMLLAVMLLMPILRAGAAEMENRCTVSVDEVIPGNLYTVCDTLIIDGMVQGDVIAAARSITINGTVQGDLLSAGGEVVINGMVGRNIRTVAARLVIASTAEIGKPHTDIAAIALSAEIDAPSAGNFYFTGYQAILNKLIGGDVRFDGQTLAVAGDIGGRVDGTVQDESIQLPNILGITFLPTGFTLADKAKVNRELALIRADQEPFLGRVGDFLVKVFKDAFALSLIGLLIALLAPRSLRATSQRVKSYPLSSGAAGLVIVAIFVLLGAVVLILSLLILIGLSVITGGELIPILTMLAVAVNSTVFGAIFFILAFLTRLVIAYMIGHFVVRWVFQTAGYLVGRIAAVLIGVLIYTALATLPYIGLPLNIIAMCVGLGALGLELEHLLRGIRLQQELNPSPILPSAAVTAQIAAPPQDSSPKPGMDNLPEGFKWFDD